jgi:hypothetical protein
MNPEYQRLRQQADHLFHRFNDALSDKSRAGSLASNVRNVVEDIEMQKNPHSIEDRVKRVVEGIKELYHADDGVMPLGHCEELKREYEDLRKEVRELSNY